MSATTTIKATTTGPGRPREFDEDAALDAALRVFWARSYEGATMSDLTEAMGINRSSMYATFGDKEALFRKAMDRYRDQSMHYVREALAQPTLRGVVEYLINGTVDFLSVPGNPKGCFSMQAGMACGTNAQPIQQAMVKWRTGGETILKKRFQQAQQAGELDPSINPADFARYLSAFMSGLGVQAVNGATKADLKRLAEIALHFLPLLDHP